MPPSADCWMAEPAITGWTRPLAACPIRATAGRWPMRCPGFRVACGDSVMLSPGCNVVSARQAKIVRHLRDTNCGDPVWWLVRREEQPECCAGAVVRLSFSFRLAAGGRHGPLLAGTHRGPSRWPARSVLRILPTGTGTTVRYQILALSRFDGDRGVDGGDLAACGADGGPGAGAWRGQGFLCAVMVNGMLSIARTA